MSSQKLPSAAHCIAFLAGLIYFVNLSQAQQFAFQNNNNNVPIQQQQQQPQQSTIDFNLQQSGLRMEALRQISSGSEKFSLQLFSKLSPEASTLGYDFIISPFSVWSLLMLMAEGAAGKTYQELQTVLGLPQDLFYIRDGYKYIQNVFRVNTSTIELAVNQALFSDKNRPVENEYEDVLKRIYEADIVPVDFHDSTDAFYQINDYVEEKTRGKITRIVLPEDLRDAQMLLISAIFFKGQWKIPFNSSLTRAEPFYDEFGNNLGNVNMMYQKEMMPYSGVPELDSYVIELGYGKENRLSMILILPRKGVSLTSVIEKLPTVGINKIQSYLRAAEQEYSDDEVELFLPRLSISADFTLNVVLEKMGLLDIFDANKADLTKMSKNSPYLSRIVHKAKIEITEEGTVASAASGGAFINKNTPPRFYANRPFAYFIIEKNTNIVLFCGQGQAGRYKKESSTTNCSGVAPRRHGPSCEAKRKLRNKSLWCSS